MSSPFSTSIKPGRPRSEQARRAVLDATRVLFEKGGYPATSIEAIAARSGVAKTTIYRWWPNRAALVVDLLLKLAAEAAPPPPVGRDPVQALRTELHLVAEAAEALPGRLLMSLLGEAQHDAEVRAALMGGLFDPRRRATARVIRQAQDQGALRQGVPPLVAVDLLFGPLFYRRFVRQEPASEAFVGQVFDNVMAGLAAPPRGTRRPGRASTGEARPMRPRPRKRT